MSEIGNSKNETAKRILGATLVALPGTIALHELTGYPWLNHQDHQKPKPLERHGDHHGSAGMPSTEHLNKFTREHGINITK